MIDLASKPLMVIISAPSGTGKTTIIREIIKLNFDFRSSISFTTRRKRTDEIEGKDYYFISRDEFYAKIEQNNFLEYDEIAGNLYGSSINKVDDTIKDGKNIIFDLNWRGALQMMNKNFYDYVSIFILPPSMNALYNRLCKRSTDDKKEINRRISMSRDEIKHFYLYKYVLINENLHNTINNIMNIIHSCKYLIKNKLNIYKKLIDLSEEKI